MHANKSKGLGTLGCGGCAAKIDPGFLHSILHKIPKVVNENLLIGFDSADDAAVYKLSEEMALVQTLDFFTPAVEDPYTFGKIAAANALSDIYAMGGQVMTALNIVCFSEKGDPEILAEILRGGAEKVREAGGVLCGGHSVNDEETKYGLSVTGIVHPAQVLANNNCEIGDKIILTKPLGVGIIMAARRVSAASDSAYQKALSQMETLNKYAAMKMKPYSVHSATDVTGFGFLGHLYEMCKKDYSIEVFAEEVTFIKEAYDYAKEFIITGAGQKNRNYLKGKVLLSGVDFAMQEILFDPQTSGGLLISVAADDAEPLLKDLKELDMESAIVGQVVERMEADIIVRGGKT